MARIIAVVNQKGGVGKTTSTVNISATLHELGQRVLLCDFDPQANATSGMGVDKNTASPNVYDVLVNGADPKKAVVKTKYGDVLPSNKALAGAGIEMIGMEGREFLLRDALAQVKPAIPPQHSDKTAIAMSKRPVCRICLISAPALTVFTRLAVMKGINASMIASATMNTRVRIVGVRYSLMQPASRFNIVVFLSGF